MALIPVYRGRLGPVAVAILLLVTVGAMVPDPIGAWRPFRLAAGKTTLTDKANALSRAVGDYVSANFAYARSLPYLRGMIGDALATPTDPRIYFGRHRRLYYNGDDTVGQSTGSIYRSDEIRHFADMADAMRNALGPSVGVVAMVPPNAQSIPSHDLPPWWRITGPLEYDLAIHELRQRGIATVDLKAEFTAMSDVDDLYFRTDTHWRNKAALIAFNLAMRAMGRSEWALDPATSLSPLTPRPGGDLARLLGLEEHYRDADYELRVIAGTAWKPVDIIRSPSYMGFFPPYAFEQASGGARIMVLGDSFTMLYWQPMLLHSDASRIGWMHLARCGFDFADVARFEPSYVILAPTERFVPCALQNWPQGLPREAHVSSP